MTGGRAVKAVLADARTGRPLNAGEWRMLAFYGWATDEQQLVPKSELADTLAQLARAADASTAAGADTATRLWLKALAASDDGQGIRADAALRERVLQVLQDPAQARRHADVLAGSAPEIVRSVSDEGSDARSAVVAQFQTALRRLQADASLSRADRLGALIARIDLARLGQPREAAQVRLPADLLEEVRAHVARDDREITDAYERQAVVTAGAYALGRAGLWADSDALLRSNLARSHSPYYLMSQLGSNARRRGETAEALRWYAQAYERSEGPATRLQWGSGYFGALVDLAPQDAARIEALAAQLFKEAAADGGAFSGRSARSLQRVGRKLVSWNADGRQAAVLQRLQRQLDGLCRKVDPVDGQRAVCQGLLKGEAKAG